MGYDITSPAIGASGPPTGPAGGDLTGTYPNPTIKTPVTLGVVTVTSINKYTLTAPAGGATLTILDGKSLTVNKILTLTGTDSTVMTFPTTSATIARTDAANTFTGHQTIEGVTSTGATGTGKFVFDGTPTLVTPVIGAATGTSVNLSGSTTTSKVILPTGAAGTAGTATLTIGTVTVATTAVTANSVILLTYNNPAGVTLGILSAPTASISAGVHFVINSADAGDSTSTVNWVIFN